jgi:hypothetical protein
MIVAAEAGMENVDQMQGVYKAKCRECHCEVHADTHTVRRCDSLPERRGRPIMFFCIECATIVYNLATVTALYDDRGWKKTDVDHGSSSC